MKIKESFDLPIGSAREYRDAVKFQDKYIYNKNAVINGETLTEKHLNQFLLKEKMGTYKFKTENDYLLKNQNKFFWGLFFYGRVGLIKNNDKVAVVRIASAEYDIYGDLINKVKIQPLNILYDFTDNNEEDDKTFDIDSEDIVICNLDNNFANFYYRYGWLSSTFMDIWTQYKLSILVSNTKLLINSNTNQKQLVKDIIEQLEDPKRWFVLLENPKLTGQNTAETMAFEDIFKINELKSLDKSIEIEECIKLWKFGKDLLGFNSSSSVKKERVISAEQEEATYNTDLMAEVEMRNFEIFTKECKDKLGLDFEIIKTLDEIQKDETQDNLDNAENENILSEVENE